MIGPPSVAIPITQEVFQVIWDIAESMPVSILPDTDPQFVDKGYTNIRLYCPNPSVTLTLYVQGEDE